MPLSGAPGVHGSSWARRVQMKQRRQQRCVPSDVRRRAYQLVQARPDRSGLSRTNRTPPLPQCNVPARARCQRVRPHTLLPVCASCSMHRMHATGGGRQPFRSVSTPQLHCPRNPLPRSRNCVLLRKSPDVLPLCSAKECSTTVCSNVRTSSNQNQKCE